MMYFTLESQDEPKGPSNLGTDLKRKKGKSEWTE